MVIEAVPALDDLLAQVRACRLCAEQLPLGPRPVLQMASTAKLLIAGQAPGAKVHASGIPFADASGKRLREWLGLSPEQFYDAAQVAILPMAFCFPGTGKGADNPPPPLCAQTWRQALLDRLPQRQLTIILGRYALDWHWPSQKQRPMADIIAAQNPAHDQQLLLPHPSPRNNRWLKQHPWFARQHIPLLKQRVAALLGPLSGG